MNAPACDGTVNCRADAHNRNCLGKPMEPDDLLALANDALDAAETLRHAFPDSSWQQSNEAADAADGLDERLARFRAQWAKYEEQRERYERMKKGTWAS